MNRDLSDYRKSYQKDSLDFDKLPENPTTLFQGWFDDADACDEISEANAFSLATMGLDGFPKSRIVLMKQFSEEGFIFYTNYNSEKGQAIASNNKVCMHFFWPALERQIIIKGQVTKVAKEVSDSYFLSRPIGSQLGALASDQSKTIPSRTFLENKLKALESEFANKPITRPENWGGYLIQAHTYEFWQGRMNRLHDRILYKLSNNIWTKNLLSP